MPDEPSVATLRAITDAFNQSGGTRAALEELLPISSALPSSQDTLAGS